jgi:uncharacterized protein (DUF2062 family)
LQRGLITIRIAFLIRPGKGKNRQLSEAAAQQIARSAKGVWVAVGNHAAGRLTVSALRAAVHEARTHAASHLAVITAASLFNETDLQRLAETCRSHPAALIIGRRPADGRTGYAARGAAWSPPRFWLKIQTGRHLHDPVSPLRIYPLALLDHLHLYQSGKALDTEMLIKSAWAGVPFREVALEADPAGVEGEPSWRRLWRFLLNIHYTLRSVLPVPHRKLVAGSGRPGNAVSVWRPMRSLRTLLRENASPNQLALAAAMGVFLGTLPLIACHTLVIILAATYFRLNKVAALAASQLCMPPVVPALCIEVGYLLRHGRFLTEISLETLGYQALERLYEWLIGALVLAPLLACLIGAVTLVLARLAARSMAGLRNVNPSPGRDAGH